MKIDTAIQAQVDAQLIEQGAYATLDLLINTGRLAYEDYERWRRGEIEFLDEVLMGARARIQAQIEAAAAYALTIRLVEQTQEFHRWGTTQARAAAKPLRSSADGHWHRLLSARYAPAQSAPQMDLFFDNPVVVLTNGIAHALATHDLGEARRQLDRLYAQAPNHADLAAFDRLTAALARLDRPVDEAAEALEFLLEIAPTARRLLAAQARDLLTPLWRQLADALTGHPYSSVAPRLHRSFALHEAQDWAGVSACIHAEPGWQRHAPLCLYLAKASFHRQQRMEALAAWCHLCWHHPEQAASALDSREQADHGIAAAWSRFQDCDDDASCAEDDSIAPLTGDFPAWLLLHEPGLTLQLPIDLPLGSTPGETHFRQMHRWIHARRSGHHEDEVALRKTLKTSSPFLFHALKRTVSA